jgi:hypothetical protein
MENSFIETVNKVRDNLDAIIKANMFFQNEEVVDKLQYLSEVDLSLITEDFAKGNYLGNRKIDINLALNVVGIDQDLIDNNPDAAELIWTDPAKTVLYNKATITFVDGVILEIPFVFDGNPIEVSTHGDLLIQLVSDVSFLEKLEDTSISGFASPVVGELVRLYDVVGTNSNLERVDLHAVRGSYKQQVVTYYWAKTTSAFQTLSMRAGDIIKLGNDIDSIILLANSIEQVLEIQSRIHEFVDTFIDGVPQGDVTIYNKLAELDAIYKELVGLIAIYDDIKVGGTNYINSVGNDLNTNEHIVTVANDLNLGDNSEIRKSGSNIEVIKAVNDNKLNIDNVVENEDYIKTVVENIDDIVEVSLNIQHVINAYTNAQNASASANSAAESEEKALAHLNAITGLNAQAIQLASSQAATAFYNPNTGVLTIGVPQGLKGDRGEAFNIDASGTMAGRSAYDGASQGFSYLALDEDPTKVYFKASDISGDWTAGVPFGKGDKGEPGDTGNGILGIVKTGTNGLVDSYRITFTNNEIFDFNVTNAKSITNIAFTSTTDASEMSGQSGATDTYTISFNNGTTQTFDVYNGADSAVLSVAGRTGNVVLSKEDIEGLVSSLYAKSDKVQTSTTESKYVDSTTDKEYKLYVENGNIVMEEL